MFQPQIKLEFVRRYCSPKAGWWVFVDIDPSEEGRTGGEFTKPEAKRRRRQMQQSAKIVREEFAKLKVQVGGCRKDWLKGVGVSDLCTVFPCLESDRDVVAIHPESKSVVIAEIEGETSGQPEQKLYKAIGQVIFAVAAVTTDDWEIGYILVVHGDGLAKRLRRVPILRLLEISALHLAEKKKNDKWLFQVETLKKLLSGEKRVPAAMCKLEANA